MAPVNQSGISIPLLHIYFSAQAVLVGDERSEWAAILSINSGPVQSFEPIDSRYNRKIYCNDWLSSQEERRRSENIDGFF